MMKPLHRLLKSLTIWVYHLTEKHLMLIHTR
uniref:Uncharacterized protein n=1 Tax=Podoviridae sp. ctG4L18 TaxID=2825234 RepID=A0A8S5UNZ8_9CAUD|nr:MAG TPA: hypothetical protein [Podoviridae sp. ctG4L18]